MNKLEVLDLPYFHEEKEIHKHSQKRIFEWIYHLRSPQQFLKSPENMVLHSCEKEFVGISSVSLTSSMMAFVCWTDLKLGTVVPDFQTVSVINIIGCQREV